MSRALISAACACLALLGARAAVAETPAPPRPVRVIEFEKKPPPLAPVEQPPAPALAVAPSGAVSRGAPPPPAPAQAEPLELDSRALPLGGALKNVELWTAYKSRFITDQGRVIDTANGQMSHSEGQGYAMLLAVAANDRVAFERIWAWTRANLMVRNDQLIAWRWEPDKRSAVGDTNNASDGDILVAWALAEAAEFWADQSYRVAGRRIAVEVGRKLVLFKTQYGAQLLPAVDGFGEEERGDGPVINLSYWIFPAFERLKLVAPEVDWKGVSQSGLDLLKLARFGPARLPTEWVSTKGKAPAPAEGFAKQFSYNAIRIPLYMAWAGVGERDHYDPFVKLWRAGAIGIVDVDSGRQTEPLMEAGYRAVAAITQCAAAGAKFPGDLKVFPANENYYPATLRLMAVIAGSMRYPACLQG